MSMQNMVCRDCDFSLFNSGMTEEAHATLGHRPLVPESDVTTGRGSHGGSDNNKKPIPKMGHKASKAKSKTSQSKSPGVVSDVY